jgi:uncharacterized RDD family membrane protein YckC
MTAAQPSSAATTARETSVGRPPSIRRRLAAFVYEGVLLFGVVMIGSYVYDTLTQHRHAMQGRTGLQVFLFLLLGIYFVWFWSHGGQTVAMKTWHIRLVDANGHNLGQPRALARYVLAWLWFVPALVAAWFYGPNSALAIFGLMAVGVAAYAALALTNPQRQFLHDIICRTRLVDVRPVDRPPPVKAG